VEANYLTVVETLAKAGTQIFFQPRDGSFKGGGVL